MKKLFYLPILLLCLLLFPITAHAETTADGFDYHIQSDSTIAISGYTGTESHITIPSIIGGKEVTHITDYAFANCTILEDVVLPSSIKYVGSYAFQNAINLSEITLPEKMTSLSPGTFQDCKSLKSVNITGYSDTIPFDFFSGCESLTSVSFCKGLKTINSEAFKNCSSLQSITLPEGITNIELAAFSNCSSLEYIQLPKTLKYLNGGFTNCPLLESIGPVNSNSNIEYTWDSAIPESAFRNLKSVKKIQITSPISTIGSDAFNHCPALKEVSLPDTLTTINSQAFNSCESLEEIILPDNISYIGRYAFGGCKSLKEFTLPSKLGVIEEGLFINCTSLSNISTNNAPVTEIRAKAFSGCSQLTEFVIPEQIHTLGDSVFKDCINLEKLTFLGNGDNLKLGYGYLEGCSKLLIAGPMGHDYNLEFAWSNQIPDNAFSASNLNEIYVTDGATYIGKKAFAFCTNLTSLYIPNSVSKISDEAFSECTSLTEIIYKGNINEWDTLESTFVYTGIYDTDAIVYIVNPFIDVNGNVFYYDPVIWAYLCDITTGTDDTHFSPVATCTRGQAVTFLWRIFGEEEPTIANPFVDINPNAFYYKAVLWAYENGITTGMDSTHFNPEGLLSRNEFVTFLWRTQDKPQPDVDNPFIDVPANMYFTDAVLWAYENGITTGMDATHFAPQELCSRAHIVTFLYRAFAEE